MPTHRLRATIVGGIGFFFISLLLLFYFFAPTQLFASHSVVKFELHELEGVISDPELQWIVYLCALLYFAMLVIPQCRIYAHSSWILKGLVWIVCTILIGTVTYLMAYSTASQSTKALMLIAGAALGQGVAVLRMFPRRCDVLLRLLIVGILSILSGVSILGSHNTSGSEYHGQIRWSWPWDNPNIYGLLMGVGIMLALGGIVWDLIRQTRIPSQGRGSMFALRYVVVILCSVTAFLIGNALLRSYSRGAWLATLCGTFYLARRAVKELKFHTSNRIRYLCNHTALVIMVIVSLVVLEFWHFRQAASRPLRRAISVGNVNDFSWRNRIAAWQGALRITAEYPFLGAGWNNPEVLYEQYYLPIRLEDGNAIQMNDYLILGATLGIPALFCFVMYVWLGLFETDEITFLKDQLRCSSPESEDVNLREVNWLRVTCRAGALVLAIGFWFDGGLFKLPTAIMFWTLIEFGRKV